MRGCRASGLGSHEWSGSLPIHKVLVQSHDIPHLYQVFVSILFIKFVPHYILHDRYPLDSNPLRLFFSVGFEITFSKLQKSNKKTMASNIITLTNLPHQLPPWQASLRSHLYAMVDMGSNGIRFSISDLSPPRTRLLKCIYRERAGISLFDALNSDSSAPMRFPPETITLVAETLARYRSIAVDDFAVPLENVILFATEAMRRAANAGDMLDAIRKETGGLEVKVLEPGVEALFGGLGARAAFVGVRGLFLDLGGGSVQMSWMDTLGDDGKDGEVGRKGYEIQAAESGQSLPFGAARLIRVLDEEVTTKEVRTAEVERLGVGMRGAFERLRRTFPALAEIVEWIRDGNHKDTREEEDQEDGIDVYLCGGGFRGYGSMLMHNDPIQPYPIPAVGGYRVPGTYFSQTKKMLKYNKTYDGKIFGMSKRRRAQFPAIVAVVDALIETVPKIRSVTFCAGGNREGVLMMMLPRELRESDPLQCLAKSIALPVSSSPTDEKTDDEIVRVVTNILKNAIPPGTTAKTVLDIGLGPLFVRQIWQNTGDSADANASAALHETINREPSCPGLSHFARAVLGITLCARWGVGLGPVDRQIFDSLAELVYAQDRDAVFWAMHVGAVAGVLAAVVPSWPRSAQRLEERAVEVRAVVVNESGKKKRRVAVTVGISVLAARGLDISRLEGLFKDGAKKWTEAWKSTTVEIQVR